MPRDFQILNGSKGEPCQRTTRGCATKRNESAADITALEHEVSVARRRYGTGWRRNSGTDVMAKAVTGLIEERQAELERSRRLT